MLRVALKGLALRKLRSVLTGVAIVLGVALVGGTYVLTDSINGAFGSIFQTVYRGTDATVTGRNAIDSGSGNGNGNGAFSGPSFPESVLARVQRLPDVLDTLGGVSGSPQLVKNGKAITFGGAPNLGFSVDPSKPQFNSLTLVSGHWPGPTEVVIDTNTASKKDLKTGQTIGVQARGPVQQMRISGLVKFGSAGSLGGATLAGFQLRTAQRLFGQVGQLDDIRVSAKPGVTPEAGRPDPHGAAAGHPGAHRGAGSTKGAGLDNLVSFVPEDVPARVRGRGPVRRELCDRQLAVDHDRAANARVRDAADARRLQEAGPARDPARVARRSG